MLLWLNSVCWVIILNTPKWDILATGVAVYFNSNLRKLKLQIYQSIRLAKVRKKPPANVQNRENKVWREREFPLLNKNVAQARSRTKLCKIHTRMTEPPNQFNQLLGIGASQAYKIIHFGKINCPREHFRFSSILKTASTPKFSEEEGTDLHVILTKACLSCSLCVITAKCKHVL